jgi:hypothetical protein
MHRFCVIGAMVIAGCLAVSLPSAMAQVGAASGYRPATSPFSPWLDLYRKNTGPLDNYHTWVRPEFRLRQTLQTQSNDIRSLQESVYQPQPAPEGNVAPTGVGGGFMNLSHYYQTQGNGRQGADVYRRPTARPTPTSFQPTGSRFF